ncbi:efflux RND transporter periplasmic adaptor subunit [Roseimaritima sediminicola]|uniref:efflux RND transporter periplasmic adaptor subunit n=1 Tax=Roseimaritima sediminicola TaxID=2662066 RepID=UPI0012982C2E|nr:HlyD family efflux transporter periplasmic adaptor subunit [Roseimaritima sediminicola]
MTEPSCASHAAPVAGSSADSHPLIAALESAAAAAARPDHSEAASLDLLTRLLTCRDSTAAYRDTAQWLQAHTDAALVVMGRCDDFLCRVESLAGTAHCPPELYPDVEAVLNESIALAGPIRGSTHPQHRDVSLTFTTLSQQVLQHNRRQVAAGRHCGLVLPLLDEDDAAIGAILVLWFGRQAIDSPQDRFLRRAAPGVAAVCGLLDRSREPRWLERCKALRKSLAGRRGQILAMALALAVVIGLVPVAYPVRADVTLHPQHRRVIAAPFDAPLGEIHVEPGQAVRSGQVLCTLDTEQAVAELAAHQAEARRIEAERAGHLAAGRLGEAELSRIEGQRNRAQRDQLRQYLQRAEIRSPIDGIVLGEDLQPHRGVPLETGQQLLEIAPLETLIAKLEIPPDQIRFVQTGQSVRLHLEAADRIDSLRLQRVAPRGEADGQGGYRFTAQTTLDNPRGQWKPGMQGTARIDTVRRPLAWCLFHRLWQRVKNWS